MRKLMTPNPLALSALLFIAGFAWTVGFPILEEGSSAAMAVEQGGPDIRHSALDCLPQDQFPQLEAVVRPGAEVQTAKVYFRSDKYPDFYYVEMKLPGVVPGTVAQAAVDAFLGILPKPSAETENVIYYVEAVDLSFESARTVEHAPSVVPTEDECRRRDPDGAYYRGDNPGIVVGATRPGAPPIPPGFQAAGITGFIDAAGVASGGGVPTGVWVGIGAGAAAAAAALLAGGDSNSPPPEPVAPPSTTTSVPPTTTAAVSVVACIETNPDPPNIRIGQSVMLDARCSRPSGQLTYSWTLGDGRTREGPTVSPVYREAGAFDAKLSVALASGLRTQNTLIRNQTVANVAEVRIRVDCHGDSAHGQIPDPSTSSGCGCPTGQVPGSPPPGENNPQAFRCVDGGPGGPAPPTTTSYLTSPSLRTTEIATSFTSFLGVQPFNGGARGTVNINQVRQDLTDNRGPAQHRFRGRMGVNQVRGQAAADGAEGGFWRFDFSTAEHFVAGSIRVESGQVFSLDGASVVFRLGKEAQEVRFTYELLP
jgi:hypothetical protein